MVIFVASQKRKNVMTLKNAVLILVFIPLMAAYVQAQTFAGTMQTAPLTFCEGEPALGIHNNDENLEPDDVLQFVLHDNAGTSLGNVLATAGTPGFAYQAGWSYGINYYVSAIAGNDDGSGNVDLSDPNLSVAAGTPVLFTEPIVVECLPEEIILTCAQPVDTVTCTGSGNYTYTWNQGSTGSFLIADVPGSYILTITNDYGCAKVEEIVVTQDVELPQVTVFGDPGISCDGDPAEINAEIAPLGFDVTFEWAGPGGFTSQTLNNVVYEPGIYCLTATNTQNGCFVESCFLVEGDTVQTNISAQICPGETYLFDGQELTTSGFYTAIFPIAGSCDSVVLLELEVFPPIVENISASICEGDIYELGGEIFDSSGVYEVNLISSQTGCDSTLILDLIVTDTLNCGRIRGQLVADEVENCQLDPGDSPLQNWLLRASSGLDTFYAMTEVDGRYEMGVTAGDYTVEVLGWNPVLWNPCQNAISVSILNGVPDTADFVIGIQETCPALEVDINANFLRRCFQNHFYVSYCNNGTAPAEDATLVVVLDPLLEFQSAGLPHTELGPGIYEFDLGTVQVGECNAFAIWVVVSCDAVLGQTLCAEAKIYPDSSCAPPDPDWSGASIAVSSTCETDSVRFVIENVGDGDMDMPLQYIVIEDGVMMMADPGTFQLNGGESEEVTLPATGATYRLEAEQEPGHPGFSMPLAFEEGCVDPPTNFSTGWVTPFSLDEADPTVSIDCQEVVGAYDPNDKQGFPTGYGPEHYIRPGQEVEYLIRFQNTGTDTAFRVVIEDVLSPHWDVESFRPGVSSHDYAVKFGGADTLCFIFDDILLPDSNVNLEGSIGFIKFYVDQKPGLPLGTAIENEAAIYFDFNEPIITNRTLHTLEENFLPVSTRNPHFERLRMNISPNPARDHAVLSLEGLNFRQGRLRIFDARGRMQRQQAVFPGRSVLQRGTLPAGIYHLELRLDGQPAAHMRLVWMD